jgi:sugar phosphate isomerase/epimerase
VFWLVKGGADPIAYLRKHPRRFTMLHIKDSGGPPQHAQVDVGAGIIDFAAILRRDADQRGAIRHVFVEHDQPADAMTFAKASFDYLKALEY